MQLPPLVVISLGNPPPYTNTLHSAGHTVLAALRDHLADNFRKHRAGKAPLAMQPLIETKPLAKSQRKPPSNPWKLESSVFRVPGGPEYQGKVIQTPQESLIAGPGIISPQPPFKVWKTRVCAAHALSQGLRFRLHQCPTLMNISGPFVFDVYHDSLRVMNESFLNSQLRHMLLPCPLVVVHDDLELPLGVLKERRWDHSARGHNGMKSVIKRMSKVAKHMWYRISVGIGRPEERTPEAVSDWVLRPTTTHEQQVLRGCGPRLLELLEGIEAKVKGRMEGRGEEEIPLEPEDPEFRTITRLEGKARMKSFK